LGGGAVGGALGAHGQQLPLAAAGGEGLAQVEALDLWIAVGAPRLQGEEAVGGKTAPVLYFGKAKINKNFGIVDAISKADGQGMTATFFVKSGDEYIRVSTNVQKPDGRGRAIGTLLDPNGKVIAQIKKGLPFYGEVMIFGVPYITAYEPIKPAGGGVIGIYYVGYQK